MPFQMTDVTAGINILYIDNAGQLGLGSLPVNGQALTVQGNGFVNQEGNLGNGVLTPGGQYGFEGIFTPGAYTATITISTTQQPIATSTAPITSLTTTTIAFLTTSGISVTYSAW